MRSFILHPSALIRTRDRPETQAVHRRDWPGTHCKHIAKNTADACGGALERFNKARMIVRFDFEVDTPVVTNTHDAAISAGRHDHSRTSRGQPLQVDS